MRGMPAAERGPAAFLETSRISESGLVDLWAAALLGFSEEEDRPRFWYSPAVRGSVRGCSAAIVASTERPDNPIFWSLALEHPYRKFEDAALFFSAPPTPAWYEASPANSFLQVQDAAADNDIVIVWAPSRLFLGRNMRTAAVDLLAACYGGGAIYEYEEDVRRRLARKRV